MRWRLRDGRCRAQHPRGLSLLPAFESWWSAPDNAGPPPIAQHRRRCRREGRTSWPWGRRPPLRPSAVPRRQSSAPRARRCPGGTTNACSRAASLNSARWRLSAYSAWACACGVSTTACCRYASCCAARLLQIEIGQPVVDQIDGQIAVPQPAVTPFQHGRVGDDRAQAVPLEQLPEQQELGVEIFVFAPPRRRWRCTAAAARSRPQRPGRPVRCCSRPASRLTKIKGCAAAPT